MTVEELMCQLSCLSPHAEVVLSVDGEGNSFRRIGDYTLEEEWWEMTCGELSPLENEPEDPQDYHIWAVCLAPEW